MEKVICPECKSLNTTKAGKIWRNRERIQRYRCSDCGRLFTPDNENPPQENTKG